MTRYYPRFGSANAHRQAVLKHFGEIVSRPADLPARVAFLFLCFTNRCGSNHLADLLAATGRVRRAREFFNGESVVSAARAHGHRDLQSYFAGLVDQHSTAQGMMACKLAVYHLELLGDAGLLEQVMKRGTFVFMTRRDRLDQAISRELARQNQRWTSKITAALPDRELVYSRSRIDLAAAAIEMENSEFESFFAANGIEPLRIEYERLMEKPQEGLNMIGNRLGFQKRLRADPERLTLSRQRGAVNDEWRERYLSPHPVRRLMERILRR